MDKSDHPSVSGAVCDLVKYSVVDSEKYIVKPEGKSGGNNIHSIVSQQKVANPSHGCRKRGEEGGMHPRQLKNQWSPPPQK